MPAVTIGLVVVVVVGYLLGSVPWAWIIGRAHGVDVRRHGSGNVGATNVGRLLGRRWGVLCFALDFLKGLLPVLAIRWWLGTDGAPSFTAGHRDLLLMAAVCAPIAGHNWSLFLGFRGGKGVAVSAGALTALTPWAVLAAGGVWLAVLATTRYVSLASMLAALSLPIAAWLPAPQTDAARCSPSLLGMLVVLALLVVVKHRGNVQRLLAGLEPKLARRSPDHSVASPNTSSKDPS